MNKLNGLIIATVAVCAAAWLASHQANKQFGLEDSQLLLPGLAKQLGDIDQVQIVAAGGDTTTLRNHDGQWQLQQRGNYPADIKSMSTALRQLAKSKALEAKTSLAENYAQLGVQDVVLANDTTLQLIANIGDQTVLDVLIGKSNRSGSFVRNTGETQSWLIDERISLARNTAEHLDKALIAVPRQEVQSVEVTPLDGPAYELSKTESAAERFTLSPTPSQGREINAANSNRLAAALANLRISDVLDESSEQGLQWSKAKVRNFAGLELQLQLAKASDVSKHYLQLQASVAGSSEEGAVTDSGLLAQVDALNARAKGRIFVAPQYTVDALLMSYDMLLKPLADKAIP
ncbi:MAG: DUF4340 domain-containing protein [Oceanococcus sp.]